MGKSDTTALTLVAKLPTATPTPAPTVSALNALKFTEANERELNTAGSGEGGSGGGGGGGGSGGGGSGGGGRARTVVVVAAETISELNESVEPTLSSSAFKRVVRIVELACESPTVTVTRWDALGEWQATENEIRTPAKRRLAASVTCTFKFAAVTLRTLAIATRMFSISGEPRSTSVRVMEKETT